MTDAVDIALTTGLVPLACHVVAIAALVVAIGLRARRWWLRWLPAAVVGGVVAVLATRYYIVSRGLTGEPVPTMLWLWILLTGVAVTLVPYGWPGARWWRRAWVVATVPLCVVCLALMVNSWVGYARTVRGAWQLITSPPLPDQISLAAAHSLAAQRAVVHRGRIVPINSGDAHSAFRPRTEYMYLPPAWFRTVGSEPLPMLMLIGGAFGTPADWLRAGDAARTLNDFAARHAGRAPVVVFPDKGGSFNNDTECVNGTRGRAADHLVDDVVPFVQRTFGTATHASSSAIAGWSMGGTCAVTLATKYPGTFGTFVSMAGDGAPNAGNRDQTVDALFGGDEAAYLAFDPETIMRRTGHYRDSAGVFAVSSPPTGRDGRAHADSHRVAADSLCATARTVRINCTVVRVEGGHDWDFGAVALRRLLPWLSARVGIGQPDGVEPPP